MDRSVGEVARLAGVAVRALHHYDEVGLLRPSDRSAAGYRVYSDDDLVRLQQQLAAIEKTLEARQMGIQLNPEEMFEVFGDFDPTEHAAEAQERWGDTDAFRESRRRTSSYTKEDWVQMKADQEEVETRLLRAMQSGLGPTSTEAMDAAEAHRANITRWFYDCDYAIHRGLADMYVADPRFTANYDNRAAGLAAFVHDAIHANADRAATS